MPGPKKKEALPKTVREVKTKNDHFVYVEKKFTHNIGDYNSVSVKIGMQLPLHYTKADTDAADDAITIALNLVDERLEEELSSSDFGFIDTEED